VSPCLSVCLSVGCAPPHQPLPWHRRSPYSDSGVPTSFLPTDVPYCACRPLHPTHARSAATIRCAHWPPRWRPRHSRVPMVIPTGPPHPDRLGPSAYKIGALASCPTPSLALFVPCKPSPPCPYFSPSRSSLPAHYDRHSSSCVGPGAPSCLGAAH
jgi:hypothetical protein